MKRIVISKNVIVAKSARAKGIESTLEIMQCTRFS